MREPSPTVKRLSERRLILDSLLLIPDREETRPQCRHCRKLLVEHQPYTLLFTRSFLNGVDLRIRDVRMDIRGEWGTSESGGSPRESGSTSAPRRSVPPVSSPGQLPGRSSSRSAVTVSIRPREKKAGKTLSVAQRSKRLS